MVRGTSRAGRLRHSSACRPRPFRAGPSAKAGQSPEQAGRRQKAQTRLRDLPTPGARRKMIAQPLSRHQSETRAHGGTHGERREPVGTGRGAREPRPRSHDQEFREGDRSGGRPRPSEGARPKDAAAVTADAERMRREIAERLGRLATERAARGCADDFDEDAPQLSVERLAALGAPRSVAARG